MAAGEQGGEQGLRRLPHVGCYTRRTWEITGFLNPYSPTDAAKPRNLITACGKGDHPKEKGATGEHSPSASHCLTVARQAPSTLFQVPLKYHSYHTIHTLIHAQEYLWLSLIPKSKPMAQQTGTSAFHTKQLFPVFNCITSRFLYAKSMQTNAILANSFVSIFMTTDTCIMQWIYPTEEKDKRFWQNQKDLEKKYSGLEWLSVSSKNYSLVPLLVKFIANGGKENTKKEKQISPLMNTLCKSPLGAYLPFTPHRCTQGWQGWFSTWAHVALERQQQSLPLWKLSKVLSHHHTHLQHIKLCICYLWILRITSPIWLNKITLLLEEASPQGLNTQADPGSGAPQSSILQESIEALKDQAASKVQCVAPGSSQSRDFWMLWEQNILPLLPCSGFSWHQPLKLAFKYRFLNHTCRQNWGLQDVSFPVSDESVK